MCHLSCFTLFTLPVGIVAFDTFENETKDDDALRVTNASHFTITCLQALGRVHHLPDVVITLTAVVIVTQHACEPFKNYCTKSPYDVFGGTQGKVATSDKLVKNRTHLHRRGFVVLPITHFEVPSVDTAALFEKIANVKGTFVIDNTSRLIDQLVTKLRNEGLNRDLVNSTIS